MHYPSHCQTSTGMSSGPTVFPFFTLFIFSLTCFLLILSTSRFTLSRSFSILSRFRHSSVPCSIPSIFSIKKNALICHYLSIFILHHSDLLYVLSRLVSLSCQSVQYIFSFLSVQPSYNSSYSLFFGLRHLFFRISLYSCLLSIPLHIPPLLCQSLLAYAFLHFFTPPPILLVFFPMF